MGVRPIAVHALHIVMTGDGLTQDVEKSKIDNNEVPLRSMAKENISPN